jgi:Mg-chelatase subunit ChlD
MSNQIVTGSLSAISQSTGKALSESFMSADVVIVLDCSGSMESHDAPGNKSRRAMAQEQLVKLQANNQGKIALVCFANYAVFSPAGIPVECGGTTNLAGALSYIQPCDDTGMKIIIVSDGSPDDEQKALGIAKQFKTPISCVYTGPEDDREGGRAFLEKLAKATGGTALKSDMPGLLEKEVTLLLEG